MKVNKNIKSFIREEDWKAIKKSLLISSLWLVLWFGLTNSSEARHSNTSHNSNSWWWASTNVHNSAASWSCHSSTHSNHSNHSSY